VSKPSQGWIAGTLATLHRLARVEGAWGQAGLDHEHVPGVHLPGVDAGCCVVEGRARGEVYNLFDDIKNELAAVQLPPEREAFRRHFAFKSSIIYLEIRLFSCRLCN